MFPCELLPNTALIVRTRKIHKQNRKPDERHHSNKAYNSVTTTRTTSVDQELEESSGLAILKYLYDKYSFFDDIPRFESTPSTLAIDSYFQGGYGGGIQQHQTKNDKCVTSGVMSMGEKVAFLQSVKPVRENIPRITLQFLAKHHFTIAILVRECGVPMANLKKAGILTSLADLMALDFQLTDLTNLTGNIECFNVGHLKQLFKTNAAKLRDEGPGFDLLLLIECQFAPADLEMLEFSLPQLIEDGGVAPRYFAQLPYSPETLITMGLDRTHLRMLGLSSANAAQAIMGWTPRQFNLFQ